MSKYFSPSEFQRCTPSCLITDMDPDFLEYLDAFREFVGILTEHRGKQAAILGAMAAVYVALTVLMYS